jgi:hypothetical protein
MAEQKTFCEKQTKKKPHHTLLILPGWGKERESRQTVFDVDWNYHYLYEIEFENTGGYENLIPPQCFTIVSPSS